MTKCKFCGGELFYSRKQFKTYSPVNKRHSNFDNMVAEWPFTKPPFINGEYVVRLALSPWPKGSRKIKRWNGTICKQCDRVSTSIVKNIILKIKTKISMRKRI